MTSKEFRRKIDFYRNFAGAALLFSTETPDVFSSCWIVNCIGVDGESFSDFTHDLTQDRIDWYLSFFELRSIYCNRFTYSQFLIQMRYFKSFVAKISKYQYAVLEQDSEMRKLLDYIKGFDI